MKNVLLLPHRFKIIGWCLLLPTVLFMIINGIHELDLHLNIRVFSLTGEGFSVGNKAPGFIDHDSLVDLIVILMIAGGLMVGFSKEKREDEFISRIRLTSLQWAVLVNYVLLILAIFLVYGLDFMSVLYYNMITVLLIYIARFNYILYRTSKQAAHEE